MCINRAFDLLFVIRLNANYFQMNVKNSVIWIFYVYLSVRMFAVFLLCLVWSFFFDFKPMCFILYPLWKMHLFCFYLTNCLMCVFRTHWIWYFEISTTFDFDEYLLSCRNSSTAAFQYVSFFSLLFSFKHGIAALFSLFLSLFSSIFSCWILQRIGEKMIVAKCLSCGDDDTLKQSSIHFSMCSIDSNTCWIDSIPFYVIEIVRHSATTSKTGRNIWTTEMWLTTRCRRLWYMNACVDFRWIRSFCFVWDNIVIGLGAFSIKETHTNKMRMNHYNDRMNSKQHKFGSILFVCIFALGWHSLFSV